MMSNMFYYMNLKQLETVVWVARLNSFAAAAAKLVSISSEAAGGFAIFSSTSAVTALSAKQTVGNLPR